MPYPAGATTVVQGAVAAHSREITSAFATVPGRTDGAASLASARSNGAFVNGLCMRILRIEAERDQQAEEAASGAISSPASMFHATRYEEE